MSRRSPSIMVKKQRMTVLSSSCHAGSASRRAETLPHVVLGMVACLVPLLHMVLGVIACLVPVPVNPPAHGLISSPAGSHPIQHAHREAVRGSDGRAGAAAACSGGFRLSESEPEEGERVSCNTDSLY